MNLESKLSALPRNIEQLSAPLQTYFYALDHYEAPFLKEKLFIEGEFSDEAEYEEAFTEFKKYVAISRVFRKPVAMTSDRIDAVWHQFILFTKDYFSFCEEFHGSYFHHNPNIPSRQNRTDAAATELRNLREGYARLYGQMPAIWSTCTEVHP